MILLNDRASLNIANQPFDNGKELIYCKIIDLLKNWYDSIKNILDRTRIAMVAYRRILTEFSLVIN
jgi:hypothetical protein